MARVIWEARELMERGSRGASGVEAEGEVAAAAVPACCIQRTLVWREVTGVARLAAPGFRRACTCTVIASWFQFFFGQIAGASGAEAEGRCGRRQDDHLEMSCQGQT